MGALRGEVQGRPPLGPPPAGGRSGAFWTPEEAAAQADAVWLDARSAAFFALSRPPGAQNLHWRAWTQPERGALRPVVELEALLGRLGVTRERPVVVAGSWEAGYGEEGHLAWLLEALGHEAVGVLYGGVARWVGAGMPVERGPARPPAARRFEASPRWEGLATGAWLRGEGAGARRVDVRRREEFEGAADRVAGRGGHLPGAVHQPWTACFEPSGALCAPEELLRRFGASEAGEVALYCSGGVRSGFVAWALRWAGAVGVRNYAASWWSWARGEDA